MMLAMPLLTAMIVETLNHRHRTRLLSYRLWISHECFIRTLRCIPYFLCCDDSRIALKEVSNPNI